MELIVVQPVLRRLVEWVNCRIFGLQPNLGVKTEETEREKR